MDVNMTKSVAFYVKNRGNFQGFLTKIPHQFMLFSLIYCLLYAYNKGFYVINHIKTTKMGFFMLFVVNTSNKFSTVFT